VGPLSSREMGGKAPASVRSPDQNAAFEGLEDGGTDMGLLP